MHEGERPESALPRRGNKMSAPCRKAEIFCPISPASSQFTQEILPILRRAYLDETSVDYFHYSQVTVVNNTKLLHQHNEWLLDMEQRGNTKEELATSFAFLMFETEDQAKAVCRKGLETGSSDITTLGDPAKGVYLCKFSDFLRPTPWNHGKQGYIVVFKIIKGRVKTVTENYTSDFTKPTPDYTCHVSTNCDKVSSRNSCFQAFELTQYYLYDPDQHEGQHCPRHVCPFAIVAFQYRDYKCNSAESGETDTDAAKIQVQYYPWRGKLVSKSNEISVALKSNGSALMPVALPTNLEIERMIKIEELKLKLPQAVFAPENYTRKEVCLEGLYCSWYELVESLEGGNSSQLGPLLAELEENNLAIVKCLQDQGLLILFGHPVSSTTGESSKTTPCTIQAVFIFKSPRISHLKDVGLQTRPRQRSPFSVKITPLLPAVDYALAAGHGLAGGQETPRNKSVEDRLGEYFEMSSEMPRNSRQVCRSAGGIPPLADGDSAAEGGSASPGDCQGSATSQLSPYLADPASYILPVATVLKLRANYLKLCQSSGNKHKVPRTSRAASAMPRAKDSLNPGQVRGRSPRARCRPADGDTPRSGAKVRATAQEPANGDTVADAGRANPTGKPQAGRAVGKGAGKVRKKASAATTRSVSRQPAKVARSATLAGGDGGTGNPAPPSLGRTTRSLSARARRAAAEELAKDSSAGQPAPAEVNGEEAKETGEPPKPGPASTAKARKMVTRRAGAAKQRPQPGLNSEQNSRYGVCTWSFVEGQSGDSPSASLHPFSLAVSQNESESQNGSEVGNWQPEKGMETDALSILADLAISSSIASLPGSQQEDALSLHLASDLSTPNIGGDRRLDCPPNPPADVKLNAAEGSQAGGGEGSATIGGTPGVVAASPCTETSRVPSPRAQAGVRARKEVTRKTPAVRRCTLLAADHSYSRPPGAREAVRLAVAKLVQADDDAAIGQSTSTTAQIRRRRRRTRPKVASKVASKGASKVASKVATKSEERSYEEGTLVGRVLPFRREDSSGINIPVPDPQKEGDAISKCAWAPDHNLTDAGLSRFDETFKQSRCVREEKNTVKVTFEWKGPYLYQWDSKYTNDPKEKSVNRALHGLWDPTIQETMRDVKLILHMWMGLFYTKSSAVLRTSVRMVQNCAGPAGEPTAVLDLATSESEAERETDPAASTVIRRVEKRLDLIAFPGGEAPTPGEEPAPGGDVGQGDGNETAAAAAAHTPSPDLEPTARTLAEEEQCSNKEPSDDVTGARSESEPREQSLDQGSTPITDESRAAEITQDDNVPDNTDDTVGNLAESIFIEKGADMEEAEIIRQDSQDEPEDESRAAEIMQDDNVPENTDDTIGNLAESNFIETGPAMEQTKIILQDSQNEPKDESRAAEITQDDNVPDNTDDTVGNLAESNFIETGPAMEQTEIIRQDSQDEPEDEITQCHNVPDNTDDTAGNLAESNFIETGPAMKQAEIIRQDSQDEPEDKSPAAEITQDDNVPDNTDDTAGNLAESNLIETGAAMEQAEIIRQDSQDEPEDKSPAAEITQDDNVPDNTDDTAGNLAESNLIETGAAMEQAEIIRQDSQDEPEDESRAAEIMQDDNDPDNTDDTVGNLAESNFIETGPATEQTEIIRQDSQDEPQDESRAAEIMQHDNVLDNTDDTAGDLAESNLIETGPAMEQAEIIRQDSQDEPEDESRAAETTQDDNVPDNTDDPVGNLAESNFIETGPAMEQAEIIRQDSQDKPEDESCAAEITQDDNVPDNTDDTVGNLAESNFIETGAAMEQAEIIRQDSQDGPEDESHAAEIMQYHNVPDNTDDAVGYLAESNCGETDPPMKETEFIRQDSQDEPEAAENQSPSASSCPDSIVEKPRSVDSGDGLAIECGQRGIIRQSSVIRELLWTKPQAHLPPPSTIPSGAVPPASRPRSHEPGESRLHSQGYDHLGSREKRTRRDEGASPPRRGLQGDESDCNSATSESPAPTRDAQSRPETPDMSGHGDSSGADSCSPLHVAGRALGNEADDYWVGNGAGDRQSGDDAETCRKRTALGAARQLQDRLEFFATNEGHRHLIKHTSHSNLPSRADTPPIFRHIPHLHLSPRADTSPFHIFHQHLPSRADRPPIHKRTSSHPHGSTDTPPIHKRTSSHTHPSRADRPPIPRHTSSHPQQSLQQADGFETVDHYANFDTEPERAVRGRGASKRALVAGEGFLEGPCGEVQPGGGSFVEEDRLGHTSHSRPARMKVSAGKERSRCARGAGRRGDVGERGRAPTRRGVEEWDYLPSGLAEDDPLVQPQPPEFIKIPDSATEGYKVFQNVRVTTRVPQTHTRTCREARKSGGRLEQQRSQASGPLPWGALDGETCRRRRKGSPIRRTLDLEFIHFSRNLQRLLEVSRSDAPPRHPDMFPRGSRGENARRRKGCSNGQGWDDSEPPLAVTISCPVTAGGRRRPGNNNNNDSSTAGPQQQLGSGEGCSRDWPSEGATAAAALFRQPKDHHGRCKRRWRAPHSQAPSRGGGGGEGEEQAERWSKKRRTARERAPRPEERRREGGLGEKRNRWDPTLCPIPNINHRDFHHSSLAPQKEAQKASYKFYVYQTNSDPFFQEVKDFLKKEGHREISFMHLSAIHSHQPGKVLVIIQNKDVETHLHQIPYLLKLKRMPRVQFAGVDSPRDLKDQTYRELFTSGGFIVSDGNVLDKITPEQLQQISDLLEEVGSESEWKWMIHFRELKKLKELAREDSAARWKISLLSRNIEANIVEVLPFHGCDSKCQTKYDYLDCLMKLQLQRISSRFAVFLSAKPENGEVFAQKGIIVMDVNNFAKDLRILSTPLQSTLVTENAIEDEDYDSTATQESTATHTSQMDPDMF